MRTTRLVALTLAFLALSTPVESQRQCKKGKPCGNTCIAQNRTCHVSPSPRPTTRTSPPASAPTKAPARASTDTAARALVDTRTDTAAAAATPATSGPWIASRRGSTYYRTGCAGGNGLAAQNRIYFKSEADAQAAGYRRSRQAGC